MFSNKSIFRMTRASPYAKLSKGLYQYISQLRENHEFEDFEVKVDGDIFSCHSFLLASFSEYFRCLLRSDMKEKQEKSVELNNISSPTFQLILNSLYTGNELLTKENVLEVWSAVHQLQIQILLEHCEDFVIDNLSLDTVDSYKKHADFFQSQKVCEYIFNFILKNFEILRDKEIFFQMDFQSLKRLLESDKLAAKSEDVILESIFKWVNYTEIGVHKSDAAVDSKDAYVNTIQDIEYNELMKGPNKDNSFLEANGNAVKEEQKIDSQNPDEPNERKKYLIELLQSTRYYLASEICILKLYNDNLIQSDILAIKMFFEAVFFKLSYHRHGHWPTSAIHRDCSDLEHLGVYCDKGEFAALSLKQNKWFSVPTLKTLKNSKLIVFKSELYACTIGRAYYNEIYVLNTNCWKSVAILKHAVKMFLAHGKSIYVLYSIEKVFIKINPDTSPIQLETIRHELKNPEFALSFHNNILVFCSVDNNGLEETAVHSWNTGNNEWTQLDILKFSSKNMTSFRDDIYTYILDSNGNLWKLTNTEVEGFTFVAKLWSLKYNVKGTVLFRKTLYIFTDNQYYVDLLKEVEGVYIKIIKWVIDQEASNCIQYVIPKRELKLKPNEGFGFKFEFGKNTNGKQGFFNTFS